MAADDDILTAPAPVVSLQSATGIARAVFDVVGECSELPSERDRNVLVAGAGASYVLKISNSAEQPAIVDMENAAMLHVAAYHPALAIPRLVPGANGDLTAAVSGDDGRQHLARLVTVLPGRPVEGTTVEPRLADEIGAVAARTANAMRGFFHPAAGRTHAWDIRGVRELSVHLDHIADAELRDLVATTLDEIGVTLDALGRLPAQILHADVTLTNILIDDRRRLSGVIDFGDMHHTAVVCDLVVTLTSVLRSVASDGWQAVTAASSHFLTGYQRHRPLLAEEAAAVADLVRARAAVSVLVSAWRAGEHPDNVDYIAQYDVSSRQLLALLGARPNAGTAFERLAGTALGALPANSGGALRTRRDAVFAGDLSPLMYDEPLELSHGSGAWLHDTDGRRYLDGYNNVPVVGHANPIVARAVSAQLGRLNVNSRYLHRNSVLLAERILATMPPELGFDTCVLVNSGSEAVDLAWRLATAHAGNGGALIGDFAYHGITSATAAFSPNEWPAGYQPAHVARFESPYPDGPTGPADEASAHERVARAVGELTGRGHAPAVLMADPLFTSAGLLDASAGFMAGLSQAASSHGALVLADEVQSGFGRTGPRWWAFAGTGLAPDIVTLGKPMGNGHPVAAVVTRREIAAALTARQPFFSTFAGNPVSAAAALATLDVIEDQQLADRALVTGELLRARVRDLATEAASIVAVRGRGLLAGVEILPRGGSAPSAPQLVERLRHDGVLVGVTGPGRNVLKVRPPLVWDESHVEVFVTALRRGLAG